MCRQKGSYFRSMSGTWWGWGDGIRIYLSEKGPMSVWKGGGAWKGHTIIVWKGGGAWKGHTIIGFLLMIEVQEVNKVWST